METVKTNPENQEPPRTKVRFEITTVYRDTLYHSNTDGKTIGEHLDVLLSRDPNITEVKLKIER